MDTRQNFPYQDYLILGREADEKTSADKLATKEEKYKLDTPERAGHLLSSKEKEGARPERGFRSLCAIPF